MAIVVVTNPGALLVGGYRLKHNGGRCTWGEKLPNNLLKLMLVIVV
jgi:hypothetical protein